MALKIAIIICFILLVLSLFTSFTFLMKDKGGTRRTWYHLSFRLVVATILMSLLFYGVYTGQLGSNAPWDQHNFEPRPSQQ
jgi:tellurite resistance protein TehA-like permease